MSDLLAIVENRDTDAELIAEIIRRHPDRVTLLIEQVLTDPADTDWAGDDSPRGLALRARLTTLRSAIEAGTGAVVVGWAANRDQLRGWRFDRIIGGRQPQPAV